MHGGRDAPHRLADIGQRKRIDHFTIAHLDPHRARRTREEAQVFILYSEGQGTIGFVEDLNIFGLGSRVYRHIDCADGSSLKVHGAERARDHPALTIRDQKWRRPRRLHATPAEVEAHQNPSLAGPSPITQQSVRGPGPPRSAPLPVPGCDGRPPAYCLRQLFDIQQGTRTGTWSPLIKQVVDKMSGDDMIAVAAYAASR